MDIQNMSNRQLEELHTAIGVELQDRHYRVLEEAITMGLYVGEVEEKYRQDYIECLEDAAGPGESPGAQQILDEWNSQQARKQSMKTTGA